MDKWSNSYQLKFALCINVCDSHRATQVARLQSYFLVKVKRTNGNFPPTGRTAIKKMRTRKSFLCRVFVSVFVPMVTVSKSHNCLFRRCCHFTRTATFCFFRPKYIIEMGGNVYWISDIADSCSSVPNLSS